MMEGSVASIGSQPQSKLEEMARSAKGLHSAAIGDSNGLPVASLLRGGKTFAATGMASMVLAAAQNVAFNLD